MRSLLVGEISPRSREPREVVESRDHDEDRAEVIFDDLKKAVRAGTFEKRRAEAERKTTALTFRAFADIYKERHVFAKKLAIGKSIDYR